MRSGEKESKLQKELFDQDGQKRVACVMEGLLAQNDLVVERVSDHQESETDSEVEGMNKALSRASERERAA